MRPVTLAWVMLLLWAAAGPAAGQPQTHFETGNAAYAEGRYEDAIEHYGAILKSGLTNNTVHYNLGNAYLRSGRIGKAIVHYERALRLDPLDNETRQNLEWVRLQLQDKIIPRGASWFARQARNFLNLWSPRGVLQAAAAANVLFFLLATLALYARGARGRLRPFLWIAGLALLATLSLAGVQAARANVKEGVIIAPEVKVRFAPSEREQEAFTLHEGTMFEIRSSVPGWLRVRLADGKGGWLVKDAVEEI